MKLIELGIIMTGNTPSKNNKEFYNSKDIPFFKPSDFSENVINELNLSEEYISESARSSARILPKNTVLMTCIGSIGKVGILKQESTCNQQINAIITNDKVIPEYLCYLLLSKKKYLQKKANAPVVPIINKTDFSNIEVSIHNIVEQKKIVEQISKIDKLINNKKVEIEKLNKLIKSLFSEMINSSNNVVKLCDLISPYKAERCGDKVYPVLSITMHNGLVLQSERFKKEIASKNKSNYKVIPRNKLVVAFPIDEGLLSAQNIVEIGIVSPAYSIYNIEESLINPIILEIYLRSEQSIKYYKSKLRGTTLRRRTIPKDDFDNMPIYLPNMNGQLNFLKKLKLIDNQKLVCEESLKKLEELQSALMQEYFG